MNDLPEFYGPNAGYVLDLYEKYQQDPEAVDAGTRAAFAHWNPLAIAPPPAESAAEMPTLASSSPPAPAIDVIKVVATARLARLIRELGHLTAHTDPLGSEPPGDPDLDPATHGLTTGDLESLPAAVVGGHSAENAANALEAIGNLRRAYSGPIGYEDDHIQVHEERQWLREAAETGRFFEKIDAGHRRDLLERLTEVETFEHFLDQTFLKEKRFSIEGGDMLVPILDEIIREAAAAGTREVVMGMAHRGRLNVLAHILGKPYAAILAEFAAAHQEEGSSVAGNGTQGYSGDVKYHQGARRKYSENGAQEMPITLAPNPSHLEFVDPVVEGRARAAQEDRRQPGLPVQDAKASLAITIHGDAAFPGQGVVAETLNLSQLPGYRVGGTIHIITNNQIGFTTDNRDARSTLYASDLAKGFEIPIVHVNADDPLACISAAKMAHAYRERFGKDFLIDLVGYRRYGHNEGDEPAYTQPRMYEAIRVHPTVRELWARELVKEGVTQPDDASALIEKVKSQLQDARAAAQDFSLNGNEADKRPVPRLLLDADTAVPAEELIALNQALLTMPQTFQPNPKLDRTVLTRRRQALNEEKAIDWGHAESLAFASILADGTPIRLTGQDSQRGTFTTRHAVLHDPSTGETYTPLQALPQAKASFAIYNSPLSENAVLGFEYGYSIHAARTLVLWEAQFGDFGNGAQVIIDQFIVSGQAKWQQAPSLVLLLPHGYEGQGPEHSSARLERYLQLCAGDNVRVVNCTTSSQYFHVLRRQAAQLESSPRPLIVMTPKMLLRHPRAASSLSDLTTGTFQPVLDDAQAAQNPDAVRRIILCSGKVYVDLVSNAAYSGNETIAAVRVEELYPFPAAELTALLARYPKAREVVWLQEEPQNMGAWSFVAPRLRGVLTPGTKLIYVGRPEAASTSEGSARMHKAKQERIVATALSGSAEPSGSAKPRRS